ncbi:MAG: glycosyltransferase [Gammaproteobacteria bacterium]|nr:glycosyltransferase [Gammaproteobacteria bacterium]
MTDIRHIHLIEPAPNLGHGPLWLGYLIDALQPALQTLTVTYPDTDSYGEIVQPRAAANRNIIARAYSWRRGKHAWRASFEGARDLRSDLTFLSDLGLLFKRVSEDLRQLTGNAIWGIWFNPPAPRGGTFWNPRRLVSRRARTAHREQVALRRAPDWLSGIWVLDAALIDLFTPRPGLQLRVLPDPWPSVPGIDRETARRALRLPLDQSLFLHPGVDAARKGLSDAIAAWQQLEEETNAVLLRVGRTNTRDAALLNELGTAGRAILRDERIPDEELDHYLRACDWLVLPYRWHESSSGLLTGAAVAGRPVIAADHGVIGRRVRDAQLGLVFPHLSVDGLAATVREALRTPPKQFDAGLRAFALEHDHEHFAAALRGAWGLN